MISGMGHADPPANGYVVTLSYDLLHVHVEVRKSSAKISLDGLESFWAHEHGIRFGKTVGFTLRAKHLVNRCFALLVPDLFVPTLQEKLIRLRHRHSPMC